MIHSGPCIRPRLHFPKLEWEIEVRKKNYFTGKLNNAAKDNNGASPVSLQQRTAAKGEINHKIGVFRQIMLDLGKCF